MFVSLIECVMNLELFREFCLSLEGTTEEMKWGYLCFMVEKKIFVILDLETQSFSSKCSLDEFDALTEIDGVKQAYHLAKRHWVSVENLTTLAPQALKDRVIASRKLVIQKLPKKLQQLYMPL